MTVKDIKGKWLLSPGDGVLMEKQKNDMLEAAQVVASLAQTGRVKPEAVTSGWRSVLQADLVDYDLDDVMDKITGAGVDAGWSNAQEYHKVNSQNRPRAL